MNTPKRKIIHRAYDTCVLECRHVDYMHDKRRKSLYCFKCCKNAPIDLAKFGISREEFDHCKKEAK